MNKVINGRRYDTSTAKELASYSHLNYGDFYHFEETLYRKSNGEYFLHGVGGPASKYAVTIGQNEWSGGERIIPLSIDAAKEWTEKYHSADTYDKIFKSAEKDGEKKTVTFSLPENVIERIKNNAAALGITMSEYISNIVKAQD